MKFNKFQKIISIVPYYSTAFIACVTMAKLTIYRASYKYWGQFLAMFFLSNIVLFVLNDLFLNNLESVLSYIICGVLFCPVNIALVNLQEKAEKIEDDNDKGK